MKKKLTGHFLFPKEKWLKSYWLMRNFIILFFVLNISVMANGLSQEVSMAHYENASLIEVFEDLKAQTGFGILYKESEINPEIHVSMLKENSTIQEVLDVALEGTILTYKVQDEVIVIYVPMQIIKPAEEVKQEKKEIKGTVTDEKGAPLPGVTVVLKGTMQGTSTDLDGKFTLDVRGKDVTLVFSFIGMKTQEVKLTDETTLNIVLHEDKAEMQEIVITGMQRREKSNMVGSVSKVTSEQLENVGSVSIDEAIKGKMAGVYIRSTSGRPGETGEIRIRGINTMTGSTEPLYVLDGMPLPAGEASGGVTSLQTNGIGNIPPEDIESITILKDATAASVYGSRAANGVLIITTKMGKSGKNYVNYSAKFGITMRPENDWEFMNSKEKVQFETELYHQYYPSNGGRAVNALNGLYNGVISQSEFDSRITSLENTNTNWMKELYRNAQTQSHNFSLSGGDAKTQYRASFNYEKSEGTLMGNDYERGGLNLKINRYVSDKFLVKFNLYSTIKKNVEGQAGMDPFKYAVFANPYEKPYNDDGTYAADMTYRNLSNDITYNSAFNYYDFNIIRELKENTLTNSIANIRGQLGLEYSFLDNFRYTGTAAVTYTSAHNIDESKPGTFRSWNNNWLNSASTAAGVLPEFNKGFLREDMFRTFDYTVRNTLEFNKKMDKHFVQAFVANEVSGKTNYGFNSFLPVYLAEYRVGGYPNWADVSPDRYDLTQLSTFGGSNFKENRSVSFIGSGVYSYDNRYAFNYNIRYDGVDIIGTDNQFAPLWSAGVKWNAHNEEFMQSIDIVDRLVLSVGYGYTGSINRSIYPFHVYQLGTTTYDGSPMATNFKYGNPVLKWEKKRDFDLGLELSMFEGRLNFEANYYSQEITDLLDNKQIAASLGRTSATVNVGTLTNKGYELSVRAQVLKSKDLLWEIGGNITQVENKLVNTFEEQYPTQALRTTDNIQGYPTNSYYGYKFSHVNAENGHAMVWAQKETINVVDGNVVTSLEDELIDLSEISFNDITSGYRTYNLGHRDPDFYGGFNTRFVYKRFDLNANFVFAAGNKIIDFSERMNAPDPDLNPTDDIRAARTNKLRGNLTRWTQPGDVSDIPAYSRNYTNYTRFLTDADLEDGSYLKCTSLSLGWRAPNSLLKKTFIKQLKVNVVASNLFTLTKYSGTDPENQTPFGYPNTRNYTFSLNIGF